ncbi:MAG: thioesterase family protein [Halioglobus sp.]
MHKYAVTLTPRFYETDAMGHINNATITAWFEVARVGFLDQLAGKDIALTRSWILASVQIDFKSETFFGADVDIHITDASIGNTSLAVHCEMYQGGRLTVQGKAVVVFIDFDSKQPQRIPDSMREKLRSLG